jgi:hypothetical protein
MQKTASVRPAQSIFSPFFFLPEISHWCRQDRCCRCLASEGMDVLRLPASRDMMLLTMVFLLSVTAGASDAERSRANRFSSCTLACDNS